LHGLTLVNNKHCDSEQATAACIYLEVHRSFGPEGPQDDKQKLKSRFLVALLASRNNNE